MLLIALWVIGDFSRSMNYALPIVIGVLWIPAALAEKQRIGSMRWNVFFGVLGIGVVSVVVRAVWLIGQA